MLPVVTLDAAYANAWRPALQAHGDADLLGWYHACAQSLPSAAVCVEVGVAHGRSVLFLAELMAALGLDAAHVYAVDPWRHSWPEEPMGYFPWPFGAVLRGLVDHASDQELEHICPLRISSPGAAKLFGARSLDLVMIDGEHDESSVAGDIKAWAPKVRKGGWLSGHDYSAEWPGVVSAVDLAYPGRTIVVGSVWAIEM